MSGRAALPESVSFHPDHAAGIYIKGHVSDRQPRLVAEARHKTQELPDILEIASQTDGHPNRTGTLAGLALSSIA